MAALITDRSLERSLIRRRRRLGIDRNDEVWNGVYVINAPSDNEHQELIGRLNCILRFVIDDQGLGLTLPGCNVSDRPKRWT